MPGGIRTQLEGVPSRLPAAIAHIIPRHMGLSALLYIYISSGEIKKETGSCLNANVFKVTEAEVVLHSLLYLSVSDSKKPIRSSPLFFVCL